MKIVHTSLIIVVLLSLTFTNCTTKVTEREDYKEVMSVHDEAMARMGEIYEMKRMLEDLASTAQDTAVAPETQQIINTLEQADEGMMDWMASFRIPEDLSNKELSSYFAQEQNKVNIVSNDINNAIDLAKQYLEANKSE